MKHVSPIRPNPIILLPEQLEIALAGYAGRAQAILNDEDRDGVIFWYDNGPNDAMPGEYHVVALSADVEKSLSLKNRDQLFVRGRANSWHVSAEAVETSAAR